MADNLRKAALDNFKLICKALDEIEYQYDTDLDNLRIKFGYITEEEDRLFVNFFIKEDQQLITLYICPDYDIQRNKRLDVAIATSVMNYDLYDGSFDLNIETGKIMFRMTTNFWDSLLSTEVIKQMLTVGVDLTESRYKVLRDINDGRLNIKDFLSK